MTRRAESPNPIPRPSPVGRAPRPLSPGPALRSGPRGGPLPSPIRRLLLAGLVLAVAGSSGCRKLSDAVRRPDRPLSVMPIEEGLGASIMPSGSARGNPNMPNDPDPMPELTSHRATSVHLDLGRAFESRGQFEAAEAEYRRAIDSFDRRLDRPTQALAHRRLAASLDRQGKFADSAYHHEQATRLDPRDHRTWNDAGYSSYLQGRYDEAIAHLRKAEQLQPSDTRVQTNLGLALAASGREDAAMQAFTRGGGPTAAEANLAYMLAASGRADEARERYEHLLGMNPNHALARRAIGQLDLDASRPATLVADRDTVVDPAVLPATFQASGSITPPTPLASPAPGSIARSAADHPDRDPPSRLRLLRKRRDRNSR